MSAIHELARQLREEDTPIAGHVVENPESTHDYSFVMEAVREGYLLHYGESRILRDYDQDLALLAGDYLYALGLNRLATLGNTAAVAVLSELISRCAQFHAEGRGDELDPLWDEAAQKIGAIS